MIDGWKEKLEHVCEKCGYELGFHRVKDNACPKVVGTSFDTIVYSDDTEFKEADE